MDQNSILRKKFRKLKPLQILAGQLRWGIPTVLGQTGKELNIPVTLISHGSHQVPDSSIAAIAQKNHAQGQLVSPLTDVTLLQSPHAKAYYQKLGVKMDLILVLSCGEIVNVLYLQKIQK